MLVFKSTNAQGLRMEIVAYLRTQMRNALAQKNINTTKHAKELCNARAFALGTAADALESATFKEGGADAHRTS